MQMRNEPVHYISFITKGEIIAWKPLHEILITPFTPLHSPAFLFRIPQIDNPVSIFGNFFGLHFHVVNLLNH